ncbi:MAG TPA: DUF4190 domain-containing protein [Catenuloplanes sp.]
MSTPPPYYPPPAAAPANDKTTLWGVLGIVFALCCPPLGILFGVLSLMEARKVNKQPILAYVAFGLAALNILANGITLASGGYGGMFNMSTTP